MNLIFMKKKILLLFAGFTFNFSVAQTTSPSIISSSGTNFSNGTSQLDFTLGETTTSTVTDGTTILSQGFHQPNLLITSINSETNYNITVFPNPATDVLQVQFDKLNQFVTIELYSGEGKLLRSQQVSTGINYQLNMSSYASGTYLLTVKDEASKMKTFQIIKTK
ncbi:MAG: hypothetical protein A3F72_11350 [Bacteroidetes bacterium RIFCSPLOWO2_12_FULL_35_15]|nr:MAG: hypothetical protein A3F72_11350 [Bacteroidetes bacterium RIFCSPLOWO2_12_FULL_35_15]